jgi:hypothetical protein
MDMDSRRMTSPKADCHYLKTNVPRSEPRMFASLEAVQIAIKDLLQLQDDRGFTTVRDTAGKHTSRHPDGRTTQFWAENARGDIVS